MKVLIKEMGLHELDDLITNLRIKNPKKPQLNPFHLFSLHNNRVIVRFFSPNIRIRLIHHHMIPMVHRRHPRRLTHRRRCRRPPSFLPCIPRQKPSQSKTLQNISTVSPINALIMARKYNETVTLD